MTWVWTDWVTELFSLILINETQISYEAQIRRISIIIYSNKAQEYSLHILLTKFLINTVISFSPLWKNKDCNFALSGFFLNYSLSRFWKIFITFKGHFLTKLDWKKTNYFMLPKTNRLLFQILNCLINLWKIIDTQGPFSSRENALKENKYV